jgi:hypothetical protein
VTGMVLPLPEPPHEDVRELNEAILIAQHELSEATVRLAWVRELQKRGRTVGTGDLMRVRVMAHVRAAAVKAWTYELAELQKRAQELGLQS